MMFYNYNIIPNPSILFWFRFRLLFYIFRKWAVIQLTESPYKPSHYYWSEYCYINYTRHTIETLNWKSKNSKIILIFNILLLCLPFFLSDCHFLIKLFNKLYYIFLIGCKCLEIVGDTGIIDSIEQIEHRCWVKLLLLNEKLCNNICTCWASLIEISGMHF